MVILDVLLPDGSGFDLYTKIRKTSNIPIKFLTAADEETYGILPQSCQYICSFSATENAIIK